MAAATAPSSLHRPQSSSPTSQTSPPPLADSAANDEVESPSVSAPHALARFEFESGRGNEGTKILMVEWEDDSGTRGVRGDWHVAWEGMRAVFPAAGADETDGLASTAAAGTTTDDEGTVAEKGGAHRMYFLLQPGVAVPPLVTLTFEPKENSKDKDGRRREKMSYQTNPLPAIFPPALGASARSAGKKGVLHTVWAKQRLRSLQREIDAESAANVESVGLTMAVQEMEWIEENFGVSARAGAPLKLQTAMGAALEGALQGQPRSPGPTSPRTPGGSRLQEKLKGLRLGTTPSELSNRQQQQQPENAASEAGGGGDFPQGQNPLSPETSDIAVSSFAAIKGARTQPLASSLAAKPAQRPAETSKRMAATQPPAAILQQQQQQQQMGSLGMGSLNAFDSFVPMTTTTTAAASTQGKGGGGGGGGGGDDDEDLFALPISPRSPEMTKSPFSLRG